MAAAVWASCSVLARLVVKAGLIPADLTLLRFAPGALLMAPLLWRRGWRDLGGVGWRRGLLHGEGSLTLAGESDVCAGLLLRPVRRAAAALAG